MLQHPEATATKIISWLTDWLRSAERDWHTDPTDDRLGWYGSGFNNWGVQTNQKYLAAAATVAANSTDPAVRDLAAGRAVAALRFSTAGHLSGSGRCADGQRWGHTWISALGIERMMFAVDLLDPWLTDADRDAVEKMLISEARWIDTDLTRGDSAHGLVADRWNSSGRNVPESNLWNGALLWRTAQRHPELPEAAAWREQAARFLINSVSVSADADSSVVLDGKPVRDRHVGANFFDSYALDHHGYLNVGYQVICLSNAALLHFDLRRRGESAPESLHHHQGELWQLVRRLVGSDGRLLRVGGDTRARYAYCQEYLLPALLYAADQHRDPFAADLLTAQLGLIRDEQQSGEDGAFYGHRLQALRRRSPYYFTRLESDRACALAFTAAYLGQTRVPAADDSTFEAAVAGGWVDHDHAAVLHRSPTRFASFAWRANGLSQGLCLPPGRADLAEWDLNLAPEIIVEGSPRSPSKLGVAVSRRLESTRIEEFDGGFLTWGRVAEGADMIITEGWAGGPAARSEIVVAALPDQQTMIGIHLVRTLDHFAGITSAKGLHLAIANDVINSGVRRLSSASLTTDLVAGEEGDQILGQWANVDDQLGVVALSGADELMISRSRERRGGPLRSIFAEEICLGFRDDHQYAPPHTAVIDCSFAVLSGVDADETRRFAAANPVSSGPADLDLRRVEVATSHGRFVLLANLGDDTSAAALPIDYRDLVKGKIHHAEIELDPMSCVLLQAVNP